MHRFEKRQNPPRAEDLTTAGDRLWHAFPVPEIEVFSDLLAVLDRPDQTSEPEEADSSVVAIA